MKKNFKLLLMLFLSVFVFVSCNNDDPEDQFPGELTQGCYVVNYGSYGKGGASISKYDYNTGVMTNFYNEQQNGGKELLSNIQYGYTYRDSVFLVGNSPDQIITMNPLMVQSKPGLTDKIANPRFCVASGEYLYISCLGLNPDWNKMPDSYIAKYKIGANTVERTFDLPGGPEGMAVSNGKLYIALNYKDSIAVFDLKNETFTYIQTPAVTSYFQPDKTGNLYVTLVNTYNNPSTETGLGYINVKTDKLEEVFRLDNVSNSYGSIISMNAAFSKLFVITSAYDENWNLSGAVEVFNTNSKTFNSEPIVSGISGISGVTINKFDDTMYLFSAQSTTGAGQMKVYASDGTSTGTHAVGAYPVGAFFQD